jgi:Flp pilus assembly protein TadD
MTFDLQNQLFSKWRLWAEHSQGKKLLFLIDGLDEAVEKNVLTYMPRENFENILIIYGSRPGGHKSIDELWATLPPEHHTPLLLKGLSMADIRALIYDVANKYELERESVWIDAVQKRSQGNPLYLRLLCNAIENSSIAINDLNALPKEIDEYYKAILSRYAQDMIDGDALLAGLFTFAAAKDYLTMAHLGLTNQLGDATIQRIGSTLKEVLYENPLTDGVLDYQLFHESFREYLVKEKAKQVNDAAERILDFCASWDTLEGTWEQRYALEHYASHLSESKKEVRVKELWGILENNRYKETQKKVLKRYDASRDLARIGLLKASELKQFDLQLECALQLVDLKYEEANGAPQVVALVADGEIDLALKRIESFGGSDQEGVKRRFILYMLCLMELTLLDSKTKTFRKAAIEKLLNHFDEQIPTDLSILNWSKFFPNDIVIKMSRVMSDLSIDYVVIYRRADESVLLTAQIDIADYLFNQGKIEEVALLINRMLDFWCDFPYALDKAVSMAKIATECFKFGNKQLAASLMNDAITGINDDINHDYYRNEAIAQISIEFSRQKLFKEALSVANQISEESTKSSVYGKISVQLSKEGQFNDALALVNGISSSIENAPTFAKISTELWREGQFIEAQTNMCKAISGARLITKCVDDAQQNGQPKNHTHSIAQMNRSSVLCVIIREHLEQGRIDESIDYVKDLILEHKSQIFVDIARKLFEKGEKKKSASFLKEAITSANDILEESDKCSSLVDISIEYNIQGYFNEAKLSMQKALEVAENNSSILLNIANQLSNGGQLVEAKQKIQYLLSLDTYNTNETLESQGVFYFAFNLAKQGRIKEAFHFASEYYEVDLTGLCKELTNIAKELIIEGRMEEALAIANQINNKHNDRDEALVNIAAELSRQGQHQEAISIVHEIEYEYCISLALAKIATDLTQCGFTKEAESLMQSALTCSRDIEDECDKTMALTNIVKELSKYGNEQEALHLTQEALISLGEDYSFYYYGVDALASIATELLNLGQLKQALFIINDIEDGIEKYEIQVKIVTELSKRGQMEKALAIAHDIDDEIEKNKALMNISTVLYKQGEIEKSEDLMKEAIDSVNDINDEYFRCRVLSDIATAFFEQSNWSAAEEIGAQIPLMQQRYDCWRQGASVLVDSVGWEKSLKSIALLRSSEAKLHYAKGWTENLNLSAVNDMCLNDSLPILFEDSNSIEIVLRKYAIRAVTKEKIPNNILDRLNRTLKIDWFFSIIDRLPKEENKVMRSSSNLNNWLHEILDEDDRDQIELWAKQVAKGKISEDEFKEKLVTLNLN